MNTQYFNTFKLIKKTLILNYCKNDQELFNLWVILKEDVSNYEK